MNPLVFTAILEVAKKLIPDKDKFKELETQVQQAKIEVDRLIMSTQTIPWVDAVVKLMYAFERFINSLWRPLGAAAMTAFGMYAHWKGIDIGEANHLLMDGAFPGWGLSRHVTKTEEIRRKRQPLLPDIELK